MIDGRRTSPAKIRVADRPIKTTESGAEHTFVEVILHEGRQRQVRRMFESIGHPVGRLRRMRIGPIADENIPIGHWRELDAQELTKLRRAHAITDCHGRIPNRATTEPNPPRRSLAQ